MLVHIELKKLNAFYFLSWLITKGFSKQKGCGFMARQVWVYGATVTHRILWVSSTVSEVFLFLRKTNFF